MIGLGSSPDQIDVDGADGLDQIELMVPWIRSTLMVQMAQLYGPP
jgi:hypothetical protein